MAELSKQCRAEVEDKVGKLAEVTDKITDAAVNIRGALGWVSDGTGHLVVLADDFEKVCGAIAPVVSKCEQIEVVCLSLPNEVGALGKIAHKLADAGISINMMYATAAGEEALIVLETSDNAKAAELI